MAQGWEKELRLTNQMKEEKTQENRSRAVTEVDGKYGTIDKTEIPIFHPGCHFLAVVP